MKRFLIVFALLLAGCAGVDVICNAPYIAVGDACCLDQDENGICDADERDACEPVLDCSACPPNIITETETIEITRYVCSDGQTTVRDLEDCVEAMQGPEVEFDPVKTNEDDQLVIEEFSVRPACQSGFQAMEIYFKVGTAANDVEFQYKTDPRAPWETLYEFSSPVFEEYLYAAFCDGPCTNNVDFFIDPGQNFLMRAKFDMTETSWERVFRSNEHVIDASPDGEYTTRLC